MRLVGRPDGFSPLHGGVCQSEDLKCAAGYVLYDGKCLLHEEKRELEANARNIRLLMASENLFKRLRRHEGFAQCGYTDAPGLYWTGEAHVIKEEFAMESDNLLFRMIEVINGELCPVAPPTAEDSYADALPLHMQRKHVMRPPCVFLEHMDADPYIHVDKALAIISLECRLRRWVRTLSMLMLGVFGVLLSLLVGQIRRKRRARAERETKEALERLLREAKARRLHSNEFYVVIEDFRRDCLKLYEADVVDEAILRARHDARVQTFKMLINGKEQKVLRWLDERQPVKEEVANTSFVQKYKPTPGPKGPIYPTF
ncbi:hypothetical protein SARC_12149 [Sphaeroforma arctica JP610]|uniref:Uncharacterized protein n=1 Tax=Sphaeroforma arctica JP610 TaxID=667725 RepID=A0A0L0FGZ8_9EUKA|nr:hypothetical protein SARC_12149 [Sphaeroforma arctica JP610]KNC75323.1 hypothetical protein SARC_12149 [Sphaeroforma arctica JP610]|eukprot:XP_014149225.1 hypothetical protein SARC_12149 [Sphaeroforma arctica JP610]